jgi:hypothetical protein
MSFSLNKKKSINIRLYTGSIMEMKSEALQSALNTTVIGGLVASQEVNQNKTRSFDVTLGPKIVLILSSMLSFCSVIS